MSQWPNRAARAAALSLVLVAGTAAPAGAAYQGPGITERGGGEYVSPGGRYVVFNPCTQGTCVIRQVYRQDRWTGEFVLASASDSGEPGNGLSSSTSMTPDGRFLVFRSDADNLMPNDANGKADIFVRDLLEGRLERISVAMDGSQGNDRSFASAISADGRFVAFGSSATNLVPGDSNDASDVFVRDRLQGTVERISLGVAGMEHDGFYAGSVGISADGTTVAFISDATNLVPGDTNGTADVFVHDLESGVTERVSVASDGAEGLCYGAVPPLPGLGFVPRWVELSANGRFVAFEFCTSNLVPNMPAGGSMVFVRDRLEGTTELAAVSSDGSPGSTDCSGADLAISNDGRFVGFSCYGSGGIVPEDENPYADAFVRDRLLGITELVSVRTDGSQALDPETAVFSHVMAMSGDGRYVTVSSNAELAPDDGSLKGGGYIRDLGPDVGLVPGLSVSETPQGLRVSGRASFAGEVASEAPDPALDSAPQVGADITMAQVLLRPEQEDIGIRIRLDALPQATGGAPGIVYGLAFEAGGTIYEVRGTRLGGADPTYPRYSLLRCAPVCLEVASLDGSLGYTGPEAFVSVPLELLGGATSLRAVRAFTAPGEVAAPGGLAPLDEVDLPDVSLGSPRIEVAIAPPGTPEGEVAFSETVLLVEGAFDGTVPLPEPGTWQVYVRACLNQCSPVESVLLTV